jgi:bla regulator protein blaR1
VTFVLSILVKATVVLIVALVAVRCSRRAPASMRHLILAAAFAVVAVLPLAERALPALTIPVGGVQTARPFLPIVMAPETTSKEATPPSVNASSHSPTRTQETGTGAPSLAAMLAAAWVIGAVVCLVPVLLTPWHLRRLRTASRPWREGESFARTLAAEIGSRPVSLSVHESVTAPLTCGIVRPMVMLPTDAIQWPEDEITRAVVHELEHVRRADWCVHVATRVMCALYWFHPLAWMAWRQLSLESERACDDAVLRVSDRTAYAQQLVTLARRHTTSSALPVLSMADRSDLSARIAALLDDTQARGRISLTRGLAVVVAAGLLVAGVAPLRAAAQSANAGRSQPGPVPAFDVVSIKENKSGETVQGSRRQPGRIVITNFPLRAVILNYFGLQPQQLTGGPDWIDSARYDIVAQFSGEIPLTEPGTIGPLQLMMQRVLAERFKLAVHTETREIPIYALTLARSNRALGPKMRPAVTDCDAVMNAMLKSAREGGGPPPGPPQLPDGRPACGMRFGPGPRLVAGGTSMAALARSMSNQAGRIIVDRTALTGGFDIELEFTPDPAAAGGQPPAAGDANLPSLFTAMEEQLGLKLVPQRGPVEMLVIDRVERPTEN